MTKRACEQTEEDVAAVKVLSLEAVENCEGSVVEGELTLDAATTG